MRSVLTILFFSFLFTVQVYGQSKSVFEKTVDSLNLIGQSEKIIPYLEMQVKNHPENEVLLRLTGYQYLQIGNLVLGEQYYRKALSINPSCSRCYLNIGLIYAAKKDFTQALTYLDTAVAIDPKDYRLFDARGTIYHQLKQPKKALEDYAKAIQLNPNDLRPYLNRAQVYFELEDMDASCQDFTTAKMLAQQLKVNDPAFFKRIDDALLDFCDNSKASFYYQRGVAFYNLKKFDKALEIYDSGLTKFPNNAMLLSFRGNTHLALKDFKNAALNYDHALANKEGLMRELKRNPRFAYMSEQDIQSYYNASIASIYYNNAECKVQSDNLDEGLSAINSAITLMPNGSSFEKELYWNRRGHIYLLQHQYKLALADFDQSIQSNDKYAVAYVNKAIAQVCLSEKSEQSKIIISSKLPNQPFKMNWVMKSKKDKPNLLNALGDCNKAIELDPNNGFSYYVRGQIKQLLNDVYYCSDLLKAKRMAIQVEDILLVDCLK
ncbi:tetratricopeptide repeat protein [Sphingobacterium anhuiense]|uniref:Tetratricopeptide repeat protein n=1 Tax=Sphingobacterium anhuiense TaxID=493780 RepID=A0ABW5YXN7_9SPHI